MKKLLPNAQEVMVRRYSLRDEQGNAVETPLEILARSARVVSNSENNYPDELKPSDVEKKFFQMLTDLRFMPNGRTLANAGAGWGQLANCFVLPIEDEMGRTGEGIFSILRKAVLILQSGGGVGFSFGRLRHKGDTISSMKGKATGAVSFLKVFDTAFWVIGQGGGRRSACMAVLPVHHPDIFDFIASKEKEGVIEHFNISVGITDEFMKAVKNEADFNLINPKNKEVVKTIKAADLFSQIVKFAHHNGEPGVLFIDAANRDNPVPNQYYLEATNPCGEQWLGPYENCCMASINLSQHLKARESHGQNPTNSASQDRLDLFPFEVDWQKLAQTVAWTTRWLDNVVDANKYVTAVPQLEEAAKKNRRIGVSIMGLADLMYSLGVRYGTDDGVELAGQIMEFIRFHSMRESINLARIRGPFPGIQDSIYDFSSASVNSKLPKLKKRLWQRPLPLKPYQLNFNRPELDWDGLEADLKHYGIRNSCQTTIQPTGAIATISGLEGYGCEPVFALSYIMRTHEGAEEQNMDWKELYYESSLFKQALQRWNKIQLKKGLKTTVSIEKIFTKVREVGSCQELTEVPPEIREVFAVSSDIKVKEHLKMQAALQAFVDNAISKTINFPASANEEEVKKAYFEGWKLGLKGMTVYVTGSREQVVLETKDTQIKKKAADEHIFDVKDDTLRGGQLTKLASNDLICPECGSAMLLGEGCANCPQCAYSYCST